VEFQRKWEGTTLRRHLQGAERYTPLILNLGMCDVDWSTSHLGRFNPVKELGYSSNRSLCGSEPACTF